MNDIDLIFEQFTRQTGKDINIKNLKKHSVFIDQTEKISSGGLTVETLYALPTSCSGEVSCILYTETSTPVINSDGDIEDFIINCYKLLLNK